MTGKGQGAGPPPFLGLLPGSERRSVAEILRAETFGGFVLLVAALIALVWANSPLADSYEHVKEFRFGPSALGLHLSVAHWTADGLLAIFFLVAGIELKRELVRGELSTPATVALPVVAALCGMAAPAGLYVLVAAAGGGSLEGWAVPMATDIAFALAVLAVISTHLPASLRAFLLTLAVVDDLGAIAITALFFTDHLNLAFLGCAIVGLAAFFLLQHFRVRGWWWYVPLGLAIWALMYNSGVHATVAGVAMGRRTLLGRRPRARRARRHRLHHRPALRRTRLPRGSQRGIRQGRGADRLTHLRSGRRRHAPAPQRRLPPTARRRGARIRQRRRR